MFKRTDLFYTKNNVIITIYQNGKTMKQLKLDLLHQKTENVT